MVVNHKWAWLFLMLICVMLLNACVVVRHDHSAHSQNHSHVQVSPSYQFWYYYPVSRVYYHITQHYYYYPDGSQWVRVNNLPPGWRLGKRVRLKLKGKPYIQHARHKREYPEKRYITARPGQHHHSNENEPSRGRGYDGHRTGPVVNRPGTDSKPEHARRGQGIDDHQSPGHTSKTPHENQKPGKGKGQSVVDKRGNPSGKEQQRAKENRGNQNRPSKVKGRANRQIIVEKSKADSGNPGKANKRDTKQGDPSEGSPNSRRPAMAKQNAREQKQRDIAMPEIETQSNIKPVEAEQQTKQFGNKNGRKKQAKASGGDKKGKPESKSTKHQSDEEGEAGELGNDVSDDEAVLLKGQGKGKNH